MKLTLLEDNTLTMRDVVLAELARDPHVDVTKMVVDAEDGVVTLTGAIESLAMSVAAERAVKRVPGVRSIANDLHLQTPAQHSDTAIAREALHRLRNNLSVPLTVQAVVHDGYITLDGTVSWLHQRAAAESAVRHLAGLKGVSNEITIVHP